MTARKPKPKPRRRKASGPTLEQRVAELEEIIDSIVEPRLTDCCARLDAIDSRGELRNKSNDEPVSNAGEAIGQHFRIRGELPHRPAWRRFLSFMGAP